MPEKIKPNQYYLYILRCVDGTLYCGQTNDIERRLNEHNSSKKGAKYTKSRRPVELIYVEEHTTIQLVLRRELEVKRFSKAKKEKLVQKLG